MRSILTALLLGLTLPSLVQGQFFSPIQVFPGSVRPDGPFLVLVRDHWSDGCGGTVETRVGADRIEITSVLASPMLDTACTQVVVPFQRLVDPRALAPGIDFGDGVTIDYRYDAGDGPALISSLRVTFSDTPNPPQTVQSGGWVTPDLERSGLFVDQQDGIFSAMLAEYDEDGRGTWYYTAGPVDGNVYSGPMQSFSEIVCVTAPCDRAAPDRVGHVDIVLLERDALLVQYRGVLESSRVNEAQPFTYERLRFARSSALDGLELAIPDLVGTWIAGVRALEDQPEDFRMVSIAFDRVDRSTGIPQYIYRATPVTQLPAIPEPEFEIRCRDDRPVDGDLGCEVTGFEAPGGPCVASFPFEAVGHERVIAPASCTGGVRYETVFDLIRLD